MKLLLDFLNVSNWTLEKLEALFRKHQLYGYYSYYNDRKDFYSDYYDTRFITRKFPQRVYFIEVSDRERELIRPDADVVFPENENGYKELFAYFKDLQANWVKELQGTVKGPDLDYINKIGESASIRFESGKKPGTVVPIQRRGYTTTFEGFLEYDYIFPFITGQNDLYNKLRFCANPQCKKIFLYKVPKQKFCCEDCRHAYHNRRKIQSGYLAKKWREGREKGLPPYFK